MDYLTLDRKPELRDPIAVVAFAGWNDAASAATNAARFIVRRLGARRFAHIEAEPFYDFREHRPSVRVDLHGNREVDWPANEFFYARNPNGPHDIVVGIGVEPDLRWNGFVRSYADLFEQLGISMVVSLGALVADVPHTRPVRVTGSAFDPLLAAQLKLSVSRYEGPTGIVGVLSQTIRERSLPSASFWANVPHYITTPQNPLATVALLGRIQQLLGIEFDFTELTAAGERFMTEVTAALSGNEEVMDYVRRLEAALDNQEPSPAGDDLPAGGDLISDVEKFLRGNQPDES